MQMRETSRVEDNKLRVNNNQKTATIQALAKFMKVPLAICDCSSLSKTGFVGADPVSVLSDLLYKADNDVALAEKGIVYLDEFDKLATRKTDNMAKDITGEGVQMELLKMVEGNIVDVPISPNKKHSSESVRLDTSHILFICGGAFTGIEDIIKERTKISDTAFGFLNKDNKEKHRTRIYNELIPLVTTEDFRKYGIMSEMLGRLPVICPMLELTEEELIDILTKPKNAIVKQYRELLKMDNAKIVFKQGSLNAIVKEAISRKIGARGLRSILERILQPAMYFAPNNKGEKEIIVTEQCVLDKTMPEIKMITKTRKPKKTQKKAEG
jgi:ATP-dependent Clp protease ATP-binding subunit ClpX